MDFNEKLQQLRKQHDLTQEQLAEQLYVSRTAISKWESGKGYPNIDSLKNVSTYFSVSIDELLFNKEHPILVEETNATRNDMYNLIYGILDVLVIIFIFLPLYGKPEGTYIRAVNLFAFTETTEVMLTIYWAIYTTIIGLGIVGLILEYQKREHWRQKVFYCSVLIEILAVCFFAAAREPYVTALLFLLLLIKGLMLIKSIRMKHNTQLTFK
ncbi:helix-turn-helix domain-containing protein [Anaerotignum sp. MB30-C6]|uniref:helix-turn-helix domain-containing protein n=1 Tax=Anaerotignum sp. MB30-C6 TaxID=3070814 RepID=UPI0027DE8551|nr:helix-turn-helix transcriptional regulator [Anaerotignum sp. MB30-C6]WMI79966.1 helix-turn-helix transcriptional regulator [Anaerotignum sp. MB30-C6]